MTNTHTTYTLQWRNAIGDKRTVEFTVTDRHMQAVDITYSTVEGGSMMYMPVPNTSWLLREGMTGMWGIEAAREIWNALISVGWEVSP